MHTALEELSEYTDVVAVKDDDGAINVYLGGQTPLVIGSHQYTLTPEVTPGQAIVRDATGADVTANVTSGRLAALVKERGTTLPSYLDDLNKLAAAVADRVNGQLKAGLDSIVNLVLPANTTPGAPIWPASGTVTVQASGTFAGVPTGTQRVTMIFLGSSTVDVTVTGSGISKSCKVDLSKTTDPGLSVGLEDPRSFVPPRSL